jgi:hypothetical protein
LKDVIRRMGPWIDPEMIKLAVEEVLENRWPRW